MRLFITTVMRSVIIVQTPLISTLITLFDPTVSTLYDSLLYSLVVSPYPYSTYNHHYIDKSTDKNCKCQVHDDD